MAANEVSPGEGHPEEFLVAPDCDCSLGTQTESHWSKCAKCFEKFLPTNLQQIILIHFAKCFAKCFREFVFETEILSSSLSFLIDRFTWAAGLLRSTLTLGAPLKAIGFNVALACLARIIVRPTVAWLHKMR